jgi:hypothetical protein
LNVLRGRKLTAWGIGFLLASTCLAGFAVVISGGALSGAITWMFLLPPRWPASCSVRAEPVRLRA